MTTPYNISSITKGVNGFGLPFSDTVYSVTLSANTEVTIAVPGSGALGSLGVDKFIAVFTYELGGTVWVALNQTAEVPAGPTFVKTTSELNPSAKYVKGGDVIHVICGSTGVDVCIAFYAVQE